MRAMSSINSLRISSSIGIPSCHFLSSKMRGFPENGRKKARNTRCALQKADTCPLTGVPCGGKTQPVWRSAPDVLGVCPRCYWDSRPRLSPPWQCARRADFPRASMLTVRPKCPVVNPFRWDLSCLNFRKACAWGREERRGCRPEPREGFHPLTLPRFARIRSIIS